MRWWGQLMGSLVDAIYPPRCGLCGLMNDEVICNSCLSEFDPLPPVWNPITVGARELAVGHCFRYVGRAGQAVRRLKYERVTGLAAPMSRDVLRTAERLGVLDSHCFVPVPIHWTREFERGFNQSVLLCEALGDARVRLGQLKRTRRTAAQAGLPKDRRFTNLQGAFHAEGFAGLKVCLIDDVCTTGSTLVHCAAELYSAGAAAVTAITWSGQPEPRDPTA